MSIWQVVPLLQKFLLTLILSDSSKSHPDLSAPSTDCPSFLWYQFFWHCDILHSAPPHGSRHDHRWSLIIDIIPMIVNSAPQLIGIQTWHFKDSLQFCRKLTGSHGSTTMTLVTAIMAIFVLSLLLLLVTVTSTMSCMAAHWMTFLLFCLFHGFGWW